MDASFVSTIANSRLVFVVVTAVGMAMCSAGIGKAARLGLWIHPITITGYVLGALALLLAAHGALRFQVLPLTNVQALVAIFGIIVLKVALAAFYGS